MTKYSVEKLGIKNYDEWDDFVDKSPQGSIFCKTGWLNIVADDYDLILCRKGDNIVGGMPIAYRKLYNIKVIAMPPLTHTLGILLAPAESKYVSKISQETKVICKLIENIPPSPHFSQNFHYNFTNSLPFFWEGYNTTVWYTYVIEDLSNIEAVWEGMRGNIKTDVRKAGKRGVELVCKPDVEKFIDVHKMTFSRQGMKYPYTEKNIKELDRMLAEHDRRKILFAIDDMGKINSAVYLCWYNDSAYYLMGGSDPRYRNNGSNAFLLWEAIKTASKVTRKFDFEGSIYSNIEPFFRAFGGLQKHHFRIWKHNSSLAKLYARLTGWS